MPAAVPESVHTMDFLLPFALLGLLLLAALSFLLAGDRHRQFVGARLDGYRARVDFDLAGGNVKGRVSTGVANVLSTTTIAPRSCAR